MKKFTITLSLMFALFLWAFTAQAVTVQIGTGTATTTTVPISSCWGYSYTQQIFLSSEITTGGGGAGPITKVRFKFVSGGSNFAVWNNWTIYLGNTAKTAFTTTTDWVPLSGLTQVFSGAIPTPVAGTWMEFTLPVSFDYTGGNLVVAVDENVSGYECSANWQSFTPGGNRGIYYRNDATNPDPASPPTGTYTTILSQVQFEMAAYVPSVPNCAIVTAPANAATGVAANALLQWASGGGLPTGYTLYFGTNNPPTNIVNGTDVGNVITYTPASPLAYSTTYYWQVVAYNVQGSATGCSVWSFTTMADPSITTLPYMESFDGTTFAPSGWTNIKVAGTGTPGIWDRQTAGTYPTCAPHSGAAMARYNCFNLSDGTKGALISPPVNVADPIVQVKFWMYRDAGYPTTADKVEVYTNTSANVVGATLLGTINRSTTLSPTVAVAGWYEYTFNITNSSKGIFYVILQGVSGYGNNIFIDDFSLVLPPACMPPSALTATDITTSSALLGWTENGTATSWNIELDEAGFTPTGVPTYSDVDNPFLVEGLTDFTAYDFYVQADCDAKALSPWVGPFNFKTLALPSTIPFFDGFEVGNTHNVAIAGWTQQAVSGTNIWTANNTLIDYNRTPKTGSWNAFLRYGNDRWMFVAVQLTGGVKYAFSMFARQDLTTEATITVSYGDAGNAAAMVNPVITETPIVNGDYQQLSGVFTPDDDGVYYVGIKGALTSTPWYLSIDDISIEIAPDPGYITGVVTDAVTGDLLEGVTVTAMPGGASDVTDASGNYSLELDLGLYELTFELPDYYETVISSVLVESATTTFQNATLAPIPPPDCSELVSPPDNLGGVLPDQPLQWELPVGSAPATGYTLLLYNITDDAWLTDEEGSDIGNVNQYLPAGGWDWGKDYVWLIYPYNNAGAPEACIPWYFTTPFTGVFEGMVTDANTGLPLEGVTITLEEILPREGFFFQETTAADGSWTFEFESGVYHVVYEKYGYETLSTPNQTLQTLQTVNLSVEMVPEVPYQLPFTETWSSGSFLTQQWTRDPFPSNWALATMGNPSPAAIFYWDPNAINYNMLLKSHFIDATNQSKVYVQFDLLLQNYDYTLETMQFVVNDGTGWQVVEEFDNWWGSIPWQTNTYDISDIVSGGLFQIGFRAIGEDSFSIDWWLIDNIIVTNKLFEVQPETIYDILFAGETADWDINIKNYGLGGIGWDAQIVPANAAMSLSQTVGTALPGTQTITLTLDANAIAPGVYDAEVIITDDDGIFMESVLVHFEVTDQMGQQIMIPEPGQWGYISTYIDMSGAKMTMEEAMADIADDMVIMLGKTGIFWPAFNINSIGEYDTYQGYKLKMANDAALAFYGMPVQNKTVSFTAGTHIIPVLSEEPILATTVFGGQPVEFAFGLDGTIYWPAGSVYTLEELVPGYGYLVRFSAPATLNFNDDKSGSIAFNKPASRVNYTTWNDVNYTGDVHIIGVSAEAAAELLPGDVVGVFGADEICVGMANYNGNNEAFALAAYADDPTTVALDGMLEGETLQVKIFRDNETIDVQPVYNQNMPEYSGSYVINGLTMIDSFKAGATSIGDENISTFAVYPNPTTGIITIDGISSTTRVMVTNTQGQIISNISIETAHQLDLSSQPSGLYFVKLVSDQGTKIVKLIVR
ncbi:MAG: T9SS type A sorting domain-containing protein [Clostridia bacterium]|nr:T9SS type A sorting domain-containing protein [Clostridia bacterium]